MAQSSSPDSSSSSSSSNSSSDESVVLKARSKGKETVKQRKINVRRRNSSTSSSDSSNDSSSNDRKGNESVDRKMTDKRENRGSHSNKRSGRSKRQPSSPIKEQEKKRSGSREGHVYSSRDRQRGSSRDRTGRSSRDRLVRGSRRQSRNHSSETRMPIRDRRALSPKRLDRSARERFERVVGVFGEPPRYDRWRDSRAGDWNRSRFSPRRRSISRGRRSRSRGRRSLSRGRRSRSRGRRSRSRGRRSQSRSRGGQSRSKGKKSQSRSGGRRSLSRSRGRSQSKNNDKRSSAKERHSRSSSNSSNSSSDSTSSSHASHSHSRNKGNATQLKKEHNLDSLKKSETMSIPKISQNDPKFSNILQPCTPSPTAVTAQIHDISSNIILKVDEKTSSEHANDSSPHKKVSENLNTNQKNESKKKLDSVILSETDKPQMNLQAEAGEAPTNISKNATSIKNADVRGETHIHANKECVNIASNSQEVVQKTVSHSQKNSNEENFAKDPTSKDIEEQPFKWLSDANQTQTSIENTSKDVSHCASDPDEFDANRKVMTDRKSEVVQVNKESEKPQIDSQITQKEANGGKLDGKNIVSSENLCDQDSNQHTSVESNVDDSSLNNTDKETTCIKQPCIQGGNGNDTRITKQTLSTNVDADSVRLDKEEKQHLTSPKFNEKQRSMKACEKELQIRKELLLKDKDTESHHTNVEICHKDTLLHEKQADLSSTVQIVTRDKEIETELHPASEYFQNTEQKIYKKGTAEEKKASSSSDDDNVNLRKQDTEFACKDLLMPKSKAKVHSHVSTSILPRSDKINFQTKDANKFKKHSSKKHRKHTDDNQLSDSSDTNDSSSGSSSESSESDTEKHDKRAKRKKKMAKNVKKSLTESKKKLCYSAKKMKHNKRDSPVDNDECYENEEDSVRVENKSLKRNHKLSSQDSTNHCETHLNKLSSDRKMKESSKHAKTIANFDEIGENCYDTATRNKNKEINSSSDTEGSRMQPTKKKSIHKNAISSKKQNRSIRTSSSKSHSQKTNKTSPCGSDSENESEKELLRKKRKIEEQLRIEMELKDKEDRNKVSKNLSEVKSYELKHLEVREEDRQRQKRHYYGDEVIGERYWGNKNTNLSKQSKMGRNERGDEYDMQIDNPGRRRDHERPMGKRIGARYHDDNTNDKINDSEYRGKKRDRSLDKETPKEDSVNKVLPAIKKPVVDPLQTRTGGAYIPPAKLRMMQAEITDKSSAAFQRLAWEALKKSINGLVNKVNVSNIGIIVRELLKENVVRGRGILCRSLMQAQAFSQTFTHVYAALVAVLNSKFPQIGELLLKRLIIQFRRGIKRSDKNICLSSSRFIAHLMNQGVAHEIVALEILSFLLEKVQDVADVTEAGDKSRSNCAELAVAFLKECGQKLKETSPRCMRQIFDSMKNIINEGKLEERIKYMFEAIWIAGRSGFKENPAVIEELDLVEEDDQITHTLELDGKIDSEDILNVFKNDTDYEANEEKYKDIKASILGETSDEGESDEDRSSGSESDEKEENKEAQEIIDQTEGNMLAFRRTIYLTLKSSITVDEAAHKILKGEIKPGWELELCNMILDCCAQERTFIKFFALLAQRFCNINRVYQECFQEIFTTAYETCHRLDAEKLRNVARLFAHLFVTDAINWTVFSVVLLNEDNTTSSSRVFLKILFQEMAEFFGLSNLNDRLRDPSLSAAYEGLLPRDNPRNTRFAINFFTSIGLGGLTDGLREFLRTQPKPTAIVAPVQQKGEESGSSSSSSDSSDSSSSSSSSSSDSSSDSSTSDSESSSSSDDRRRRKKNSNHRERDRKAISGTSVTRREGRRGDHSQGRGDSRRHERASDNARSEERDQSRRSERDHGLDRRGERDLSRQRGRDDEDRRERETKRHRGRSSSRSRRHEHRQRY